MLVGAFNDVVFEASNFKVATYDNYKRDSKAKYAEHELIGNAPKLEYLHRELETISLTMTFHKMLGVEPAEECQTMRDYCFDGEYGYLILYNQAIGDNAWVVESVSESVEFWDENGILASKIDVTFKEYIENEDDGEYD